MYLDRIVSVILVAGLQTALCSVESANSLSPSAALALAKKYLSEQDQAKKQAFLDQVGDTPADPALLIKALSPASYAPVKPGVFDGLMLPLPSTLSDKPAEYSLLVPPKYLPNHPWPLVIGLHGGGEGVGSGAQHMKGMSGVEDAIVVCPTSMDLGVQAYWRNPKNETMLALLVKDLSRRFPIDPDRVYLSGYSMGGIGTYYLAPRLCERYAAVAPGGGAWSAIYWKQLLNTPVFIWHGRKDMRGDQFTNFPYAEHAGEGLTEANVPYELHAMDSGHADFPSSEFLTMTKWLLTKKRDPYPKHIVHASPCAKDFSVPAAPSPPDRWLSIDQIGTTEQVMDGVTFGGAQRAPQKFPFGTLDATWTGPNVLEVTAINVKRFHVLLSPKLVDFKKQLHVLVNGAKIFDGPIRSSLAFGLRYADEHRDIGMIYVGEVPIDLPSVP